MARELFDVWWDFSSSAWRVQLVGYIGTFPTKEAAEVYVDSVKAYRRKFEVKSK